MEGCKCILIEEDKRDYKLSRNLNNFFLNMSCKCRDFCAYPVQILGRSKYLNLHKKKSNARRMELKTKKKREETSSSTSDATINKRHLVPLEHTLPFL